jgi:hypothetical protein
MTAMATSKERKIGMNCRRCGGRMIFEKFYDINSVFFGWHCVICGDILDAYSPHRLGKDADLRILKKNKSYASAEKYPCPDKGFERGRKK